MKRIYHVGLGIVIFAATFALITCCVGRHQNPSETEPQVTVIRSEFVSEESGTSLTLYICISEDADKTDDKVTGLNMDVLSAVIDFTKILTQREFEVYGYPCGIFQGESVSYACWTSSPEGCGILEYDPEAISEEEVMKVMESVYQNPNT